MFQRLLQSSGVEEFNGAQGRILYVLWQAEDVPIVELSAATGLAKNTLTSMLARMEESGLITRFPSPQDRRQTLIRLTPRAKGLQQRYDEVSQAMNEWFFGGFSPAEIAQLEGYLDRIVDNLEQSEKQLKLKEKKDNGKSTG